MFSSLVSVLLLASTALAGQVIDVQVGGPNGELTFSPEAISAQPGDQVVYHFNPKNHTVTQSSFASPCGYSGGISSGFMPVMSNQTGSPPTFTVMVNDTKPIWIYCAQGANTPQSHCGLGMVHAINCGQDGSPNSFTNFKNAALAIGKSLASGSSTAPPPAYSTTPASSPPTTANVIPVVVGGSAGNLTFTPSRVSAQPGDTVMFQFQQKNHTVTQSTFAEPCARLSNATTGQVGFDSGFMFVDAGATEFPTWNLTVNDTNPIWAYCRQKTPASHCGAGMVFAINSVESSSKNFAAFQALAKQLNGTSSTGGASAATGSAAAVTAGRGIFIALAATCLGLLF